MMMEVKVMADYNKAQMEAEKVCEKLFLKTPPIPILEVAESYGLSVLETDLTDHPGLSGVIDVEKQIIYLNKSDNPVHKRFTIAHELGHWILHREALYQKDSSLAIYYRRPIGGETDDKEKEANCFAANLLVPLEHLKPYYNKHYSCRDLSELFAVSQQVIGYRLQEWLAWDS